MERVREQEHALSTTEKTHQLEDLLRLSKGTTQAPADNFWELKKNIATFMSLVWVLFGSDCDYYKSLHQIFKTLELKEVYTLKASFSLENCCRITWAILDNGRAFFNNAKTMIDFTGLEMTFPQLYLIDILNNVWYAVPVERASFPDKWQHRDRVKDNKGQGRTSGVQGGRERTGNNSLPRGGYGDGAGGANRQNNYGQGGFGGAGQVFNPYGGQGGGQQDWRAGWIDVCNHELKAMMNPYMKWYNGRIHLAEVLNAARKQQQDLPTLPCFCYAKSQPFLCWNSTLGWCMYHKCKYLQDGGHPGPNNIPDKFANKVIGVIRKGIQACMQPVGGEGSPGKRPKLS
jgi:hypothetical protein